MHVEVVPFTEQEILDRDDPIKSIRVRYDSDDLVLEDDESKMLEDFSNYVISKDPRHNRIRESRSEYIELFA